MFCDLNSVPDSLCSCIWVLGLSSPPRTVDAEYSPVAVRSSSASGDGNPACVTFSALNCCFSRCVHRSHLHSSPEERRGRLSRSAPRMDVLKGTVF